MNMKSFLSVAFVSLISIVVQAQGDIKAPLFLQSESNWADSVLSQMTLEEKIGQLFMVAAYSNRDQDHETELSKLVEDYHIGGVIFFQGGPQREVKMYNALQKKAKYPLWVGMDAEWGLGMRLDSTIKFPRQLTLGAVQNDTLIYRMGMEIGRQCRRVGVHINFAPVVDVNNNPKNPVINSRSFGENKLWVTRKGDAYMKGLEAAGTMANAKHFPGHGDTETDSHHNLPVIKHDADRLANVELYPFRKLIDEGLSSVMVAHLSVPALDSANNRASTLSPEIVTDLLKDQYGFQGLIFTDALNMKGVASFYEPGQVDLMAAQAGNDVLLFAEDVGKAVDLISKAIESKDYSEKRLDESVLKILRAKEWLGLDKDRFVEEHHIIEDINTPAALMLKKRLSEAAMTLIKNEDSVLPIHLTDSTKVGVITIGGGGKVFAKALNGYIPNDHFSLPANLSSADKESWVKKLANFDTVIVHISGTNNRPNKNFGLSKSAISLAEAIGSQSTTILVHMGNPYALENLSQPEAFKAILIGYQDDPIMHRAAADALVGVNDVNGKLPVRIGDLFPAQTGLKIEANQRLQTAADPVLKYYGDSFQKVDSIAELGLAKKAYPGAQVLVAQGGRVIYDKTFGYHTYEKKDPVKRTDVYDIASITKVVATTVSLMKLQDMGKFSLDEPMKTYFPEIEKSSPYANLTSRQMLAHVAGLKPWIPFYIETVDDGVPDSILYSDVNSDVYSVEVAKDLYIDNRYSDSLLTKILATPLNKKGEYKYSDLGYYFMREIIKRQSGMRVDSFAYQFIYRPMGLQRIGYLPLERIDADEIVPTEYDQYFRNQLLIGYTHDPGAAMQGGVGGHAGVFSNAYDIAAIMQMFLNNGTYGGVKILDPSTVAEYTKCQYCEDELDENRRGAGFDKPVIPDGPGPTCKCVSFDSFGHSGFTGTIAWADPSEDIIYVFLSNRVYPSAENNRLAKMDIRTNIQEEIYKVLVPSRPLPENP